MTHSCSGETMKQLKEMIALWCVVMRHERVLRQGVDLEQLNLVKQKTFERFRKLLFPFIACIPDGWCICLFHSIVIMFNLLHTLIVLVFFIFYLYLLGFLKLLNFGFFVKYFLVFLNIISSYKWFALPQLVLQFQDFD